MKSKINEAEQGKNEVEVSPVFQWIQAHVAFLAAIIGLIIIIKSLAEIFVGGFVLKFVVLVASIGSILIFLSIDYRGQKLDHKLIKKRINKFFAEARFFLEKKIQTKLEKVIFWLSVGMVALVLLSANYQTVNNIINISGVTIRDLAILFSGNPNLNPTYLQSIGIAIVFLIILNVIYVGSLLNKSTPVIMRNVDFLESYFNEYINNRMTENWSKIWIWLEEPGFDYQRLYYRLNYASVGRNSHLFMYQRPNLSEEQCKSYFLDKLESIKSVIHEFGFVEYSCKDTRRRLFLGAMTPRAELVLNNNLYFLQSVFNLYLAEKVFDVHVFCDAQCRVIEEIVVLLGGDKIRSNYSGESTKTHSV
jgi:hypothetical protein